LVFFVRSTQIFLVFRPSFSTFDISLIPLISISDLIKSLFNQKTYTHWNIITPMPSMFVAVVLSSAFIFSVVDAQMDVSTCGTMKGCLFAPPGCQPSTDCRIAFSYQGDDMVVYCANFAGQVAAGLANNVGIQDVLRTSNIGGELYCEVKMAISSEISGILMTLAWSIFIGTAILFARHMKEHFPDSYHRTLNMIGIAGTIAGFVAVFVANDWRWIGPKANQSAEQNRQWGSVHAMLGLIACVVAWAQPLNAVFRCHPEDKGRFIFNWIHGFLGFGAWLCAASATMIAVVHFAGMFSNRDAALGIYIAFIVVTGLTVITMETLTFKRWWTNRDRVTSEIEMTHVGGSDSIANRNATMKIRAVQLLLLMVFVVVAIGASVAISYTENHPELVTPLFHAMSKRKSLDVFMGFSFPKEFEHDVENAESVKLYIEMRDGWSDGLMDCSDETECGSTTASLLNNIDKNYNDDISFDWR
uniref:Cytochrome b561 domain-containing protein n=1 Tax=Angiostrongylus cantonensis TaxID=6313 RepID=A0A158PB71_ANGCA